LEPEAGQDIAARQRLLLGKDNGFGEGGVDSDCPSARIDEPDQATTGIELFAYLSRHRPRRIAFALHFNGKIWREWKNRSASAAMVRQSITEPAPPARQSTDQGTVQPSPTISCYTPCYGARDIMHYNIPVKLVISLKADAITKGASDRADNRTRLNFVFDLIALSDNHLGVGFRRCDDIDDPAM
jgi:hypothetical protein